MCPPRNLSFLILTFLMFICKVGRLYLLRIQVIGQNLSPSVAARGYRYLFLLMHLAKYSLEIAIPLRQLFGHDVSKYSRVPTATAKRRNTTTASINKWANLDAVKSITGCCLLGLAAWHSGLEASDTSCPSWRLLGRSNTVYLQVRGKVWLYLEPRSPCFFLSFTDISNSP